MNCLCSPFGDGPQAPCSQRKPIKPTITCVKTKNGSVQQSSPVFQSSSPVNVYTPVDFYTTVLLILSVKWLILTGVVSLWCEMLKWWFLVLEGIWASNSYLVFLLICFSSYNIHSVHFPSFQPSRNQHSPTKLDFWALLIPYLHFVLHDLANPPSPTQQEHAN